MTFVHLNTHSHYSLLDALGTPKDIVKKAKEFNCTAIGLTDNSYLYGAVEFYKAAKDSGIKAIIGCEFHITSGSRFDKTPESLKTTFRLTILAKNNQGYQNILKLSSIASLEGFHQQYPRIDFETLTAHHEGLIVLSGNIYSELSQALLNNDLAKAKKIASAYRELFPNNYYLEIQRHPQIPEYSQIEGDLIKLSQELNIPLVATQSSHYLKPDDAGPHDILLCIGNQTNLNNPDRPRYAGDFSLKSPTEMREIFSDLSEACDNTVKIAEQCEVSLKFGQYLIPQFKTPAGQTSKEYLRELCQKGLQELYLPEMHERAQKQLDYELEVVDKMGFNDYFLIVWDFINYAKSNGIIVGPGRGSAAGAIIAYTLKITELDPIEHGLVFERFLNPDRISMPDIDIDFADTRRHEVLQYTLNKYGQDCVSQVITYGTMSAKAAVRDVGRGMGYPYSEVDAIAKAVPQPILGKHAPLNISVQKDPNLSDLYKNNPRAKELLDNAIRLEGTVRNAGTHACAVIIADRPLVNFTPLQRATDGSDGKVTQYSMKYLEDIGLLKMDFLGLKNLTIIEKTLELIKARTGEQIDITKIPLTDQKTFELLQRGDTTGVFQLESSGMRRYIRELKPTHFEDIVAMISLYRPGPMEWIPAYIEGKHRPETVKYLDPSFTSILKETNGIAIYQEQILLIARHFAGFSLGEADILRRAVGKKDPKALAEQKDKFVQGGVTQGHTQKHGKEIFEKVIEPFAGYGFNKAHAACYAMISYRTSYLKAHYSTELMAALLTSDSDNAEKVAQEMADCEDMNIKVLPPSINHSELGFSVIAEGEIRFGLGAIKGLGEGAIQHIIDNRKANGPFTSLENLASRLPTKLVNKKTIECLAYSGALDEFGDRTQIAENYEVISGFAKNIEKSKSGNVDQTDLFGMSDQSNDLQQKLKLKAVSPLTLMEKLKKEKDYLGLYVSSTPLKGLGRYLKSKAKFIGDFTEKDLDKTHKVAGLLTSIKTLITKAGSPMAYAELEDATSKINVVIFPKVYQEYKFKIKEDQVMIASGKLEYRRGYLQFAVYELKAVSLETMIKNAKDAGIYDLQEKIQRRHPNINPDKPKEKENPIESPNSSPEKNIKFKHLSIYKEKILIRIPTQFKPEDFQKLKTILSNLPGELPVELEITQQGSAKILKTAIKLNPSETNLLQIEKFLG
jgi:DNA polymerase-3 subunit alpha